MSTTYSIGDLAREFDLTTRAIRFYEDLGLLQPERRGPAGRQRVYSGRDRTRLKLTLRAKRLGLSLTEAKEIIDMYDSPRDTGAQLQKFLDVLAAHRAQIEEQMADLQANLEEIKVHQREARALLAGATQFKASADTKGATKASPKPKVKVNAGAKSETVSETVPKAASSAVPRAAPKPEPKAKPQGRAALAA
jgi:DNA-binding transcriptional MerR regulator